MGTIDAVDLVRSVGEGISGVLNGAALEEIAAIREAAIPIDMTCGSEKHLNTIAMRSAVDQCSYTVDMAYAIG